MKVNMKIVILIFILNVRNINCNSQTSNSSDIDNEIENAAKFSLESDKLSLEYLLRKCKKDSSLTCIQRSIYQYFNNVLNLETINVTNNVILKRNDIGYGEFNGSESNNFAKYTITGMFVAVFHKNIFQTKISSLSVIQNHSNVDETFVLHSVLEYNSE